MSAESQAQRTSQSSQASKQSEQPANLQPVMPALTLQANLATLPLQMQFMSAAAGAQTLNAAVKLLLPDC